MPSKSLAQDRYIRVQAAKGKSWAKKWIADEHGKKIPHVQKKRYAKLKHG